MRTKQEALHKLEVLIMMGLRQGIPYQKLLEHQEVEEYVQACVQAGATVIEITKTMHQCLN